MDLFGGILALLAFVVVVLVGLFRGAPVDQVLVKAIIAMGCFALLGAAWGAVGRRVVKGEDSGGSVAETKPAEKEAE